MSLPAFEVWNPNTNERWKIWADGRTEGFADPHVIINRIPAIAQAAYAAGSRADELPQEEHHDT